MEILGVRRRPVTKTRPRHKIKYLLFPTLNVPLSLTHGKFSSTFSLRYEEGQVSALLSRYYPFIFRQQLGSGMYPGAPSIPEQLHQLICLSFEAPDRDQD